MKKLILLITVLFVIKANSQYIHVEKTNPVSRNYTYFDDANGILKLKTTFSISLGSKDSIDTGSVRYNGIVKYTATNKVDETVEGIMEHMGASDFIASIKNNNQTEFGKIATPGNAWSNISLTVSYKLNGIIYKLPSYVINSNGSQEAKATKLSIEPSATYLNNSVGIIKVKVSGVNSVTFTKVESSNTSTITTTIMETSRISGPKNGIYELKINLPQDNNGPFHIKVYSVSSDDNRVDITPVEKDLAFQNQIMITNIEGALKQNEISELILNDKKNADFKINTTGNTGELKVDNNLTNYQLNIKQSSTGVYNLNITSSKLIFDDEQDIVFRADGNQLDGKYKIKRPSPDILISAEQTNTNDVIFTVTLPKWINGNLRLILPNKTSIPIENSSAVIEGENKKFTATIKSDQFLSASTDAIFVSYVKVMLDEKSLLSAQYKFINLAHYQLKIKKIQNSTMSNNTKKQEINKIVESIFASTNSSIDDPQVKKISKNLASDKTTDRDTGWNDILSFAVKFAPVILAAL